MRLFHILLHKNKVKVETQLLLLIQKTNFKIRNPTIAPFPG